MTYSATGSKPLFDPLDYLPSSKVVFYKKKQTIYSQHEPATQLYLVVDGKVRISRIAHGGNIVFLDIYRNDEVFGESVLAGALKHTESAVAHENTNVMTWNAREIEKLTAVRPQLAIALLQIMVRRSMDLMSQIESFASENIEQRLARALLRFSEKFGERMDDGAVSMMAFPHQLLSEYVGTSREIVTHYLNHFRRQGFLKYSRKAIVLYGDGLERLLRRFPTRG
jgi:CRP-like cAMP-binding protein